MSTSSCINSPELEACRDEKTAIILKLVAMASILLAGIIGVALPMVGKNWRLLRSDSTFFFATKAFAAGVILATGFVHMLADATSALTDPCLPNIPWSTFPFSGFIAMMAALTTLLADFISTQYYEKKHENTIQNETFEDGGSALAAAVVPLVVKEDGTDGVNDTDSILRHAVVSQVLELGIISHSIVIGLSLGVSQSPCTIRPLLGALSFHQFFEGFALADCISQARFGLFRSTLMGSFFAITAPISVAIGICIASFYNPNSPRALIIEGILDSISAGILIYMALVDLIAAEFLSKKMRSSFGNQMVSFTALFLGAGLMACLAAWA